MRIDKFTIGNGILGKILLFSSLFIFLILFQQTPASGQTVTLRSQQITLKEAFSKIEDQTGMSIDYDERVIDVNKKVNVNIRNNSLEEALSKLLEGSGLTFTIDGKHVLISSRNVPSQQQKRITITGKVSDNVGPLAGVNILEKGTTNGVMTDLDGNYSLSVMPNSTLQFSSIGYLTKEVPVNGMTNINIQMSEDREMLDEIVVVGYGTQKKVDLTGSISTIKAEDLDKIPVSNLSNSLAGRAPGVNVTGNTGFAGASSTIRIRGSFGDPLYVIDDVIKSKADFDALDANEVETISFLKDAASASIYGSKAGNGVILVTTKQGAVQKPKFSYSGTYSVSHTTRHLQDWTAQEELTYLNNVSISNGGDIIYGQDIYDYFADKSYSVNDYVWQNPQNQQHNISVNGGGDRITYFMMLGYHDEDGSYKTLKYQKYNFRSDITAKITDSFKIRFNISGNQRYDKRFYWPYDSVDNFTVPDFYRTTFNWSRLYPFYTDAEGNPVTHRTEYPVIRDSWNPVEMVLGNRYWKTKKRTLDGQLRFDLDLGKILPGLSTSLVGHYTAYDMNRKALITHNKGYVFQSASETNPFIPAAPDPNKMTSHNLSSTYEGIREYAVFEHSYQLNWYLNYKNKFGKHDVSALVLYEQAEDKYKGFNGAAWDMLTTNIDQIFVTSSDADKRDFTGSESESARQSWVGRANYIYDDKYIAEFSFRYDGNYKFGPGYRWGFFPSFSAAWRISQENFMNNIPWVSNLKLRASYGTTGDDNNWDGSSIGAFQWREYYASATGYAFGTSYNNGLTIGSTYNPKLTWATLKNYDIGVDFGLFEDKLSGEFEYFYKDKTDILRSRNATVPGTYGASLAQENYAEQEWHGFEASLSYSNHVGAFNYNVYANIGYSKDKWVYLDEPEGLQEWRSAIGKPNNRVQGYICEKMLRTQEDLDQLPDGFTQFGRTPVLGTLLFKDIRGADYSEGPDGKIDSNDYTYLSDNGSPRINYGFGFNLEWKGLSLNAHFQGVGKYDRMVATKNGGVFQVSNKPYFELWTGDVWTPENTDAKYPRVAGVWLQPEYGGGYSTFWMRNGAYCRLKNLNIAYQLPEKLFERIGIIGVSVFFNGTNLFCIDNFDEMDPEQSLLDSYPIMKTYTFGLNINF